MSKFIVKAKAHKVQDGESIKSLADVAGIKWQELAKFNWGTDNPNRINTFLRNKVGCRKKTKDGNNYIFTSNDNPGILYIPEELTEKSFSSSVEHEIIVEHPNNLSAECTIKGIYAHKQMEYIAESLSEAAFIALLAPIFGSDIPGDAYRKLYRAYSDKAFPQPNYKVVNQKLRDDKGNEFLGGYDKETQTISVYYELVINAITEELSQLQSDDDKILFTILSEEYGHYIDDRLRNQFSKVQGDAKNDEGAIFAYKLAFLEKIESGKTHYADVQEPSYSGSLHLNFTEAINALKEYASPIDQLQDDAYKNWEFLSSFIHNQPNNKRIYDHFRVEKVIEKAGFNDKERLEIYVGNWLRDFSQFVDPMITRPEPSREAQAQAELNRTMDNITYQLLPFRQSRRQITNIVSYFMLTDFGKLDFDLAKYYHEELWGPNGMKLLGCYRPMEHIDNPLPSDLPRKKWRNNSLIDPDFVPPPADVHLAVNAETGMLNYITTDYIDPDTKKLIHPSPVNYMTERFQLAIDNRNNPLVAHRHFGEGLHVLEDFFAHSNFCELALIKLGYIVYPWVEVDGFSLRPTYDYKKEYSRNPKKAKSNLPLVTGCFFGDDLLGSFAPKFAELIPRELKPYEFFTPGERSFEDKIMIALMEDLDKGQESNFYEKNKTYKGKSENKFFTNLFNSYLLVRDALNDKNLLGNENVQKQLKSLHDFLNENINKHLMNLINIPLYMSLRRHADTIDDNITRSSKNFKTNPHHTQIAKDNENRHLHSLAGKLIEIAVLEVGKEMRDALKKGDILATPDMAAKKYIVHPFDFDGLDNEIRDWAKNNLAEVERAKYKTDEAYEKKHARDEWRKINKSQEKIYPKVKSAIKVFSGIYNKESEGNKNNIFKGY